MSDARSLLSPGLTLVAGMLIGGLAGVYGTRLLDGDAPRSTVDPSPNPVRECPPCETCPACPPPPECGDVSLIPARDDDPGLDRDPLDDPPDRPDIAPAGPGLSARAIAQASAAVRVAIEPCLLSDQLDGAQGMLLLDLTVTATGSVGFVTEALVTARNGDTEAVEACVQREAARARFDYAGPDGAQRVKLPIKIGR